MTREQGNDWLGLEGRSVVVTGGGSGIGAAIVLELARHGMNVAVLDIDEQGATALAAQAQGYGVASCGLRVDTSDSDSVNAAAAAVTDRLGDIDTLVNNAGILRPGELATLPLESWQRVLDVDLTGYFLCAQAFGKCMLERQRGVMVHVASICGVSPQQFAGAYSPAKAAVSMLSRSLAVEWGPRGIRSNSLSPGMIRTPLSEHIYSTPGLAEARSVLVPAQRIGTPQDIADAVAWLVSDRSSYITGQNVTVDGGLGNTVMNQIPGPDSMK